MHTTAKFLTSLFFVALLVACACDGPTQPRMINPREYIWTVDTLEYPGSFQTTMRDIWGSSPTNVYVVGHNASPGPGTMYRFNGSAWTTTGFHAAEGGPIVGALSLWSVYGFSANDVWAVGERIYSNPTPPPNFLDSSLIIHYNGSTWTEHKVTEGRSLNAIWGIAPNDIWAGGGEGTLFHYDGTVWTKYPIARNFAVTSIHGSASNNVYAIGLELDSLGVTTSYFLHWDGISWSVVDSNRQTDGIRFGDGEVRVFGNEIFTAGYGVFKKLIGGWDQMFFDPSTSFADLYGQSSSNFFVAGIFGAVYHYNGVDWKRYDTLFDSDTHYLATWSTDREAFIVGFVGGGEKSIVRRGKATMPAWFLNTK